MRRRSRRSSKLLADHLCRSSRRPCTSSAAARSTNRDVELRIVRGDTTATYCLAVVRPIARRRGRISRAAGCVSCSAALQSVADIVVPVEELQGHEEARRRAAVVAAAYRAGAARRARRRGRRAHLADRERSVRLAEHRSELPPEHLPQARGALPRRVSSSCSTRQTRSRRPTGTANCQPLVLRSRSAMIVMTWSAKVGCSCTRYVKCFWSTATTRVGVVAVAVALRGLHR